MLVFAACLGPTAAGAQALSDPMRPPALRPGGAAPELPADSHGGLRLESVLISPQRRIAVIDGRVVAPGDRVGDATLVAIGATEVTLRRGQERQTLKLHPGVEKRPVPRPTAIEGKP